MRDGLAERDDGGNEIIGSIMLIAITVLAGAGLALAVGTSLKPAPHAYADLSVTLSDTDGTWGNGNEVVSVSHRGGQRLPTSAITIYTQVGTAARTQQAGVSLGGPFADGTFVIGESWSQTVTVPACTNVGVDVAYAFQGASQLLATQRLVSGGCPGGP